MKKLGRFMKEKREAMGLSLRDASRLSGISHTHIRDIEDGRSIPSFEMVMRFLKAYMVDIRHWRGILRGMDNTTISMSQQRLLMMFGSK